MWLISVMNGLQSVPASLQLYLPKVVFVQSWWSMFGSDVAVNMWPHRVTKEVKAVREDGLGACILTISLISAVPCWRQHRQFQQVWHMSRCKFSLPLAWACCCQWALLVYLNPTLVISSYNFFHTKFFYIQSYYSPYNHLTNGKVSESESMPTNKPITALPDFFTHLPSMKPW